MNTTADHNALELLQHTLSTLTAPTGKAAELTGQQLRALATGGTALFTFLRQQLAQTTDPRLALELASTGQALADEATRTKLAAADRLNATNAHTLHEDELHALRTTAPATHTTPRRCAGKATFQNPAALLASWTQIPFGAANKLINDAQDLVSRRDIAGNQLPPRFTHLAALLNTPTAAGSVPPALVQETSHKLARREPKDQSFDGTPTETTLYHGDGRPVEEHAAQLLAAGHSLAETQKQVCELITEASTNEATATAASLRRGLFALPVDNALTREFLLRVTTLEAELLDSIIDQANNSRTLAGAQARVNPQPPNTSPESEPVLPDFLPEGVGNESRWDPETTEPTASIPERALNAVLDILGNTPSNSGERHQIRPEVLVHLQVNDLQNLAVGTARTAHGKNLPPGDLRRLLCDADMIPAVFNSRSELLDYGRAQRLVPAKLKRAVLARDRGCLVPGCTEPVGRMEFHHIQPWALGGETKLDNLAALCRGAHMDADSGRLGVVLVGRLPHVVLPAHQDPQQEPRRNTYWG